MSLMDGLIKISLKKNFAKWLAGAGTAIVAAGAPYLAKHVGIELTEEQKIQLAVAVGASVVGLTNFVKQHLPAKYAAWIP